LPSLPLRDSFASTALAEIIDRSAHATAARFTGGLSPAAGWAAALDWATHLAFSPGKQFQLWQKGWKKGLRWWNHALNCALSQGSATPCISPLPQDKRFNAPAWQQPPYHLIYQGFLLHQQWWHNATTGVRGVTAQHEQAVGFAARQWLDMLSPGNHPLTNPEVAERTRLEGGMNLLRGWQNWVEDRERALSGRAPVGAEAYRVGVEVATTPGQVVWRSPLAELIQYEPLTPAVKPEPVLIVPAWIMKFYILDLSPHNSLVRHLLQQGYTVFLVSWKNPMPEDRDQGMDDYREAFMGALQAVQAICRRAGQDPCVHAVGYCLGGTLLAIAAAAMAREGDARLRSVTLLAAQTDFTQAGELMLFINDSQLTFLEDMMWEQGLLDAKQMAGAFNLLRTSDLVWSRMVRHYLLGEREPMSDLMAWNADATRMPYRMHTEYLRQLFLHNDLAEGRYRVGGQPVSLADIEAPLFAVATEWDHVAPWRSVFKLHQLAHAELTFVLGSGGHNAGIVSEPGRAGRRYRMAPARSAEAGNGHALHVPQGAPARPSHARESSPEAWLASAELHEGSWWQPWVAWLHARSGPEVPPPPTGAAEAGYAPLMPAPGSYVMQT
jgi:polyhydroxyalkanoate synthase